MSKEESLNSSQVKSIMTASQTALGSNDKSLAAKFAVYDSMSSEEKIAMKYRHDQEDEERFQITADGHARISRQAFSSLPERDWQIKLETLRDNGQSDRLLIERIMKWNPAMDRGIVFWGDVGTGKTTLCKAIINRFASTSCRCKLITVADTMRTLRNAIGSDSTTLAYEIKKLVEDPKILVLDDLGVDNGSDFTREQIISLLEARWARKYHTMVTTNLTSDKITDTYGERLNDRLVEYCTWIKVGGESYRRKNYRPEF